MKKKIKKGYMCGTAFTHELENTNVTIYSNSKLDYSDVHKECGTALVEIKFVKWVKKPSKLT